MILSPVLYPPAGQASNSQIALYRAQLSEIDRDVARQILREDDAERTRTEIARRLLAASQTRQVNKTPPSVPRRFVGVVFVGMIGLAWGGYLTIGAPGYGDLPLQARIDAAEVLRSNRPSQDAAEANARVLSPPDYADDYLASVDQLRTMVPARGDDLRGWELLAYHEARLLRFPAAAKAQARVVAIKGAGATADDLLRHADLLVAAADGYVSPEAEAVVRDVLEIAPQSVGGRYYLGALFDQSDRPDLAFRLWRPILESGSPDSVYLRLVRDQIAGAAFRAGVVYTMPEQGLARAEVLPGPTAAQVRDAQDMETKDRAAMIEGMVSGLAQRLRTEGGSPAEWARLITAYGVLGRTVEGKAVISEAQEVFSGSQDALQQLNDAARSAGFLNYKK